MVVVVLQKVPRVHTSQVTLILLAGPTSIYIVKLRDQQDQSKNQHYWRYQCNIPSPIIYLGFYT